jgi:hypothetical protein
MMGCKMRMLLAPAGPLVLFFVLVLGQPSGAMAQLTEKQGDAIVNELRQIRQALKIATTAGNWATRTSASSRTNPRQSLNQRPACARI